MRSRALEGWLNSGKLARSEGDPKLHGHVLRSPGELQCGSQVLSPWFHGLGVGRCGSTLQSSGSTVEVPLPPD